MAAAHKTYRAYSMGMKQRLAIAACLLQPRELLVLDEPTNGLDPQGTREVRHLVASLAEGGTTVLVSSHLLTDLAQRNSLDKTASPARKSGIPPGPGNQPVSGAAMMSAKPKMATARRNQ